MRFDTIPFPYTKKETNTMDHDGLATFTEIRNAAARTLSLLLFADAIDTRDDKGGPTELSEEASYFLGSSPGPGADWDDSAPQDPPADPAAERAVDSLLDLLGGPEAVLELFARWTRAGGEGTERFGHCLALDSLGAGVGLEDDVSWDPSGRREPSGPRERFRIPSSLEEIHWTDLEVWGRPQPDSDSGARAELMPGEALL